VLLYEDFRNEVVLEYPCKVPDGEAVQLDFATNKLQKKIWGVSEFNKDRIVFSEWWIRE
jgi:hypothetical protein